MPESKIRKDAAEKKKQARHEALVEKRTERKRTIASPGSRQWVAPTFITIGILSMLWLVVYYITASVGITIPYMTDLGGGNILIGMGGLGVAFALTTLWK